MRKKHWIIGLMALLALMVGVGSGTVLAQENREDRERPVQGVISRVAIILGLEEQQVQDAFDQARREMRDERFEEMVGQRLDALVERRTHNPGTSGRASRVVHCATGLLLACRRA